MTKLLFLFCLAGCVEHVALEPLPCPCSAGWMCCGNPNVCVREGGTCPAPSPTPITPDQTCEPNAPAGETVSTGFGFNCGIKTDGHLICWGDYAPAALSGTYTSLSVGYNHLCAIRTNGTVACRGSNMFGETTPPAGTFVQISVHGLYSCALATDGTVACWGNGPPATAGSFRMVSVNGSNNACALATDDTLVCWGPNENGEATPPSGKFATLDAGNDTVCALRHNGAGECWGWSSWRGTNGYRQISAGGSHGCALRCDSTIECWGGNVNGEVDAPSGTFKAVSSGAINSCALDDQGKVVCWGDNHYNQLTVPDVTFLH